MLNCFAYIGHDGLMDFSINEQFNNTDGVTRDAIHAGLYQ